MIEKDILKVLSDLASEEINEDRMTEDDLTEKVISTLGLTEFHKNLISNYVFDGIEFLKSSGVKYDVIYSRKSIGVLSQYVNDIWNYNQGQIKLSPFLKERVIQLTLCDGDEDV